MEMFYNPANSHGLVSSNNNRSSSEGNLTEEGIISLLIVLGSSLSLVALVFAFITYSLFSDLRNLSGTTLMNLLSALFMTQLLYVIGVSGAMDSDLCMVLASALHYTRLCVFSWTLLMAHHMYSQYRNGLHLEPIIENNIGKIFIRYSFIGWGVPSIFLLASILGQYCYNNNNNGLNLIRSENCWFLNKNSFIFGLVLPCFAMEGLTFFYLLRSAFLSRYMMSLEPEKRIRNKIQRKQTLQIVLFAKIALVHGICLALAGIAKLMDSKSIWILFHIIQGLQGIFTAMFVTCNCRVLKLYTKNFKNSSHIPIISCAGGHPSTSGINKSTSMQMLTWDPPPDLV